MDSDLYDEFGNYVGPELDSDDEEDDVPVRGIDDDEDEKEDQVNTESNDAYKLS